MRCASRRSPSSPRGIAVGAARVPRHDRAGAVARPAGLPAVSSVLVDEAVLVCPGQQRLGAAGLRDVARRRRRRRVGGSRPPRCAARGSPRLRERVRSTSRAEAPAPSSPPGRRWTVSWRPRSPPPTPVVARARGALAPGLVATQVWRHTGDDDRGLAVTPCGLPSADAWLVGGAAGALAHRAHRRQQPRRQRRVRVLRGLRSRRTRSAAAEGRSVSIPPRERAVVSLDALAPDEPAPAVHVTATGGVVSAVLADQWIDGATARGIDDSVPAAAPATDQVVAGLDVAATTSLRLRQPRPR